MKLAWKTRAQLEIDACISDPKIHDLLRIDPDYVVNKSIHDFTTKLYCDYDQFVLVAFQGVG